MLKYLIVFSAVLTVSVFANAQSCLSDGITFSTQSEIDGFPSLYPDCSTIEGFVTILGDDITNLDSLYTIAAINGSLSIGGGENANPLLDSITGLNNITWIGGDLSILENDSAVYADLLVNLDSIGGDFNIIGNDFLPTLNGFSDLVRIGEDLNIDSNNYFSYFTFLSNLNFIGGSFNLGLFLSGSEWYPVDFSGMENLDTIAGNFTMTNAFNIGGFGGLSSLHSIGGDLMIRGGFFLSSFDGLENLEHIGGKLYLYDNYNLASISGLSGITSLDSGLYVIQNYNLPSISGLASLDHIGTAIEISGNEFLSSIDEFSFVDSLQSLKISDNLLLEDLSFVSELTTVSESVIISNNSLISNFVPLANLNRLEGSLQIDNNESLISIEGLEGLDSIGGSLLISENTVLQDLSGLSNLSYIADSLYIHYNDSLHDLQGLNYLEEVGGNFIVSYHFEMYSLDGLDSLRTIGDVLKLEYNTLLSDISSLENLSFEDMTLIGFEGNYLLSECAFQSLCDYLANPPASTDFYFIDNGVGCNSEAEVQEQCLGLDVNLLITSQGEIDAFPSTCQLCDSISGNLIIVGPDIVNLDSLSSIVQVNGNVIIGDSIGNPNLTSLSGLSNLSSIGGSLSVQNNAALENFAGFVSSMNAMELSSLSQIGGDLKIAHNESLQNLSGLEDLETIGGDLIIEDNISMTSLMGITNLDYQSIQNLYIFNNPELSTCQVQTVCSYIGDPTGVTEIYNNNEDCNSADEVYAICSVGVEEVSNNLNVSIYPNPAKDKLYITSSKNEKLNELRIFNQVGMQVYYSSAFDSPIDISSLLPGVYIVQIKSEKGVSSNKLVIE
jgi:hypothetical protein